MKKAKNTNKTGHFQPVTANKIAEALGFSTQQLWRLTQDGLPRLPGKNPRKYDPQAVMDWCLSKGKHKYIMDLVKAFPYLGVGESSCSVNPVPTSGGLESLDDFVQRVRFAEAVTGAAVEHANDQTREFRIQAHREAAELRRKVEKDISDIQLSQSRVVPADVAAQKFREAGEMVKSQLQSLPGKLAGICEGRKASEICAIMEKEIHSVLKELSK